MRLHFEIKSGVHIHRDNFNVGSIIAELFKEWTNVLSASAYTNPEHLMTLCVSDDGSVPMTFKNSELVHNKLTQIIPRHRWNNSFKTVFINVLNRMPMHSGQLGDMLDG
ncbi:hypothetical protein GCM10027342_54400 [Photobacterium alginatilyticum]